MTDYTKGGGITAGIVEFMMYFFFLPKGDLTPFEVFLVCYIFGLISYFAYLSFKKQNKPNPSLKPSTLWDGNEILAGFFGAILPLIPIIIIGTLLEIK